jgi:hypothetical protein
MPLGGGSDGEEGDGFEVNDTGVFACQFSPRDKLGVA